MNAQTDTPTPSTTPTANLGPTWTPPGFAVTNTPVPGSDKSLCPDVLPDLDYVSQAWASSCGYCYREEGPSGYQQAINQVPALQDAPIPTQRALTCNLVATPDAEGHIPEPESCLPADEWLATNVPDHYAATLTNEAAYAATWEAFNQATDYPTWTPQPTWTPTATAEPAYYLIIFDDWHPDLSLLQGVAKNTWTAWHDVIYTLVDLEGNPIGTEYAGTYRLQLQDHGTVNPDGSISGTYTNLQTWRDFEVFIEFSGNVYVDAGSLEVYSSGSKLYTAYGIWMLDSADQAAQEVGGAQNHYNGSGYPNYGPGIDTTFVMAEGWASDPGSYQWMFAPTHLTRIVWVRVSGFARSDDPWVQRMGDVSLDLSWEYQFPTPTPGPTLTPTATLTLSPTIPAGTYQPIIQAPPVYLNDCRVIDYCYDPEIPCYAEELVSFVVPDNFLPESSDCETIVPEIDLEIGNIWIYINKVRVCLDYYPLPPIQFLGIAVSTDWLALGIVGWLLRRLSVL